MGDDTEDGGAFNRRRFMADAIEEFSQGDRKPLGKVHPPEWMTDAPTRRVLDALTAGGGEVRFVGGCVRDTILRQPANDIDIATAEPPATVMERLSTAGIRAIPTGIDHGTITAVVDHRHFEITTLRVDVATDGRHARVRFTDDWKADAARRDFTINALSCTPDGDVFDYFHGLDDLASGSVRFVGDARTRIVEDGLRILRFFRFHGRFGRPPADIEAMDACREHAADVERLSGERVQAELLKTLLVPDPAETVLLMDEAHVLGHLIPEAAAAARTAGIGRLRALAWLETRAIRVNGIAPDALRRLAALLTPGSETGGLAERLRLATADRVRLAALTAADPVVEPADGEAARQRHRLFYRHGRATVRDRALIAWAGEVATLGRVSPGRTAAWVDLVTEAATGVDAVFPLKGRDALDLGIPPGPAVGALLRMVEDWWIGGDFSADRSACLAHLRTLVDRARTP